MPAYHNFGVIYPDLPAIADHLNIDVNQIVNYQEWATVFFVKIQLAADKVVYRFVSYSFIRKTIKTVKGFAKKLTKANIAPQEQEYYRVIRTLDYGKSPNWKGDYAISALVQKVHGSQKPKWVAILKSKGAERDNILVKNEQNRFDVTSKNYGELMGLY